MNKPITKEMIIGFQAKTRLFSQRSRDYNKTIDMITDVDTQRIWFIVVDCHIQSYTGPNLDEAIDTFNRI